MNAIIIETWGTIRQSCINSAFFNFQSDWAMYKRYD